MLIVCLIHLIQATPFNNPNTNCPDAFQGDGLCDEGCMTIDNQFDSKAKAKDPKELIFTSDCISECLNKGCSKELLKNERCDLECNITECGWDNGECGYCAPGCYKTLLGNNEKDEVCNTKNCFYDNNQFGWCAKDCFYEDLNSDTPKSACNVQECNYQNGKTLPGFSPDGCNKLLLLNKECDEICNTVEFNYDNKSCICADGCTDEILAGNNCSWSSPCMNLDCNFLDGKCPICSINCLVSNIGDGICQKECNNQECEYDRGDCSCAIGCKSAYINGRWNMQQDCGDSCLVESCLFNYEVCDDSVSMSLAIIYSFILRDFNISFIIDKTSDCSIELLKSLPNNSDYDTKAPCDNINCEKCIDDRNIDVIKCLDYVKKNCIKTSETDFFYYRGDKIINTVSILNFSTSIEKINSMIGANVYFTREGSYSFNSPLNINVDQELSLYDAMVMANARFVIINIESGEYNLTSDSSLAKTELLLNPSAPLYKDNGYTQYSLIIQGSGPSSTSVNFIKEISFKNNFLKTIIRNITFKGHLLISNKHTLNFFMFNYCPCVNIFSDFNFTDRYELIDETFKNYYDNVCDKEMILFEFFNETYIENVHFYNFQQQPLGFIISNASLTITDTIFERMQMKQEYYVIRFYCSINDPLACSKISLELNRVQVIDLNYGYEHLDNMYQGGFLTVEGTGDILFESVEFSFNMQVSCSECTDLSLLEFKNVLGTIDILNSKFESMYVRTLIKIDSSTIVYGENLINDFDTHKRIKVFSMNHLFINNTTFLNIYAQDTIILYLMRNIKQNIKVDYCNFTNIAIMKYGIIKVDGQDTLTDAENEGYFSYQVSKYFSIRTRVYYSPRFITLSNLNLINIRAGPYAFNFVKYPNIVMEKINIEDINETSEDDSYFYSIVYFEEAKKYLTQLPDRSLFKIDSLMSVFCASNINYIAFKSISSRNISSNSFDFCVYYVENAKANVTFTEVPLSNITGYTGMGIVVNLESIGEIFMSDVTLAELSNSYSSLVAISKTKNVSMNNFFIENVLTNISAAITLDGIERLSITNFYVHLLESYDSKGSLFNFNLGITPKVLEISNITVINSINSKGKGLFIYLDSLSSQSSFNLAFTDIILKDCTVEDSLLYFEFNLFFNEAIISNLLIESSDSNNGGIITDIHSKGILQLVNFKSIKNKGIYCGLVTKYTSSEYLLSISDSIVENGNCVSDVFSINGIPGTEVEINNLTIYNNIVVNSGISVTNALVEAMGVYLYDSFLVYGIFISMGEMNISDLYCENITGQSVYLMSSIFSCYGCNFKNLSNTVLSAYQNSTFNIEDSYFTDIISTDQGFLYITNTETVFSSFKNSFFSTSYSAKGQFEMDKSKLNITNCTVKDNTSSGGICIRLGSSDLNVFESKFLNHPYTIIEASVNSEINIESSEFYGNLTNIEGISSDLSQNRNILGGQNLKTFGGAVYVKDSSLTITNSTFKELYSTLGAAIYSELTTIRISSSNFKNCGTSKSDAGVIYLKNQEVYIESSTFSESLTETSLIYAESVEKLLIKSCIFSDNKNEKGSGINLFGSDCEVETSLLTNNSASKYGAGIYSDSSSLKISNSSFQLNKADTDGGGVYFQSSPKEQNILSFYGDNYFTSNSAVTGSGGAINWKCKVPEINGFNYYYNNSAIYGSDNSAYPVQLFFGPGRSLNTIPNFRPGGQYKESFQICFGDIYNNIIKSTDFDQAVANLYVNKYSSLSGTTTFNSKSGCFDLTGFILKGTPGSEITLELKTDYIISQANRYGNEIINDSINITVKLRHCTYGEAVYHDECISCLAGKYLIEPADTCLSCSTGAECLGGYLELPKAGYWKMDKYSDQIYECPYNQACLGSINISDSIEVENLDINEANVDFSGTCATGYHGNMCSSCEIGYSKSTNGKCSKCPNESSNALIMTGFLILSVAIAYVMITSTLKSAFSTKSLYSIYIKIFTNYLQIVFLTTELNLSWPSYVVQLFSVQRSAASASDQIYSIDCLFSDKSDFSKEEIYYYKILLAALLPAIVWSISFLVWLIISLYKESYHYLKKELFTTMIVLFFLIHPNIVKTIFSSFSCREIKNNGYWIVTDLQIRCWTASHVRNLLIISLPGVVVWGFGIPFLVMIVMIKRRKFLNKDSNKVIFGFIYNGYRQKKFFWEFVILYRKIFIICISVFMSTVSTTIQALSVVILLICALYFQYSQHPYVYKQLNYMEIEALLTATITIYCGLYYLSNDLNNYIKTALFILILIGNVYFIIYWIYYMIKAVVDILVKVFPILRKILKKGDYFNKSLFVKNLQNKGVFFDKIDGEKKFTFFRPVSSKLKVSIENLSTMDDLFKACMNEKPTNFKK